MFISIDQFFYKNNNCYGYVNTNNSQHLLRTHYLLGIVLRVLHVLTHLIQQLDTFEDFCLFRFTNKETEAQISVIQGQIGKKWLSQY